MPMVLIWAATGVAGLFATTQLVDEIGDTTDRIAPNIMMIGGGLALAGAAYMVLKGRA
jgi:hypothetical protein